MDSSPSHAAVQRRTGTAAAASMPHAVPLRGPVLRGLARAALNTTAVVVQYYVLPLDRPVSWRTVGWLIGFHCPQCGYLPLH